MEIFGNTPFPEVREDPYLLTMGPHSFFWFSLQAKEIVHALADLPSGTDQLPMFTVREHWEELFQGDVSSQMQNRLHTYLSVQRWFGAKTRRIKMLSVMEMLPLRGEGLTAVLLFIYIQFTDGDGEIYALPLAHIALDAAEDLYEKYPLAILARVQERTSNTQGLLVDGLHHREFCLMLLNMISRRAVAKGNRGRMTAIPAPGFKVLQKEKEMSCEVSLMKAEQSNSSVVFSDRFILKLFRRVQEGTNPDLEIGRFLTRKGFAHLPQVLGALEYTQDGKDPATLAILQAYVPNQGDAWSYTLNNLYQYFEILLETHGKLEHAPLPEGSLPTIAQEQIPESVAEGIGIFLDSVRMMAERTAQMHIVLASDDKDSKFTPEPFTKLYLRSLYQSMRSMAGRILPQLQRRIALLPQAPRAAAERILARKKEIIGTFDALTGLEITAKRIRCHGDYHLGQILYTGRDFVIIDFEGEPARAVSERRIKRSPLYDVAGMVRSFHYAAHSALIEEQARGLFHPENVPLMASWADYWYRWVGAAFLKRYMEVAAEGNYLPKTGHEFEVLFNAFLMEKAIYEIGYEMDNRPDWIAIPLEGIEQLLGPSPDGRNES